MKKRMDLFSLKGKTALVTGGSGLLGSRFSHALASQGAKVAVVDVDRKAAERLAVSIRKEHRTEACGIGCDVSDPASVRSMLRSSEKALGPADILLNNAASKSKDLQAFFEPFETYSLTQWRKVSGVNLDGMFLVAQAVGAAMLRRGKGGSIIQTASIYGLLAPDQRIYEGSRYLDRSINTPAVYTATKAGVIGLTKHLAALWAEKGIRVNTLIPGGVESGQNETFVRRYSARVPMGRMARPDEMCGAVVFLASDASSYVTGQSLAVDGGLSVW